MQQENKNQDFRYYIMYKPYNVLNQFSKERPEHSTLADFLKVEKDVYPLGRLDKDSEGLVLLTNDKKLNNLLLSPSQKHNRTYLVQVDGDITQAAVELLMKGIEIKLDSGLYKTLPCVIKKLSKTPALPERNPPVRFRKLIPTSWIKIELREGKNRQIRKMLAAMGFPVLRLVRVQIEEVRLGTMQPGEYKSIKKEELYSLLKINDVLKEKVQKSEQQPKRTPGKTGSGRNKNAGSKKPAGKMADKAKFRKK